MFDMNILVTCPPMIQVLDDLRELFSELNWTVEAPEIAQQMSEKELVSLLPEYDGWIAGDDPVSRTTLAAGSAGQLKAVIKWGIGTDNVDFEAADDLGIRVTNTPGTFGDEVADVATAYVIGMARHLFEIDRGVRAGGWPKLQGLSLRGRVAGIVGYGDIGKSTAKRLEAVGMRVVVYDPYVEDVPSEHVAKEWPQGLGDVDFLVLTCPLTEETRRMVNAESLARAKEGVRLVNVARGELVDEDALIDALRTRHVAGAALDVFEREPLPSHSPLREYPYCVLGAHNASNTREAARRASTQAVNFLAEFLENPRLSKP